MYLIEYLEGTLLSKFCPSLFIISNFILKFIYMEGELCNRSACTFFKLLMLVVISILIYLCLILMTYVLNKYLNVSETLFCLSMIILTVVLIVTII